MKYKTSIILIVLFAKFSFAQIGLTYYNEAFEKLNNMLNDKSELSFKDAVFTVENAYMNNTLDYAYFNHRIQSLATFSKAIIKSRTLIYDFDDRKEVEKYSALFTLMTDSVPIQIDSNTIVYSQPYTYDFNDIWGNKDWKNMFVIKLLETQKGNCHSLPFLYKILAEEIGAKAYLAIAPNHFYIKHKNMANGWYNTELTSGMFPIDAWLMASGYIHLDAVVNKLYMEALNEKQSIAICMVDLAKGYEKKYSDFDRNFIIQCCDTALKYYPNYINALILKAETKKKQFEDLMQKYYAEYAKEILDKPEAKQLFEEMTALYGQIHKLGYRKMPEEMYLKWLTSLKEQRKLYENKNIINFTKSKQK